MQRRADEKIFIFLLGSFTGDGGRTETGGLPASPTPEERIVIAIMAIVRPRCVDPPSVVKLLLGLHNGLQTRGDEVARLRRQGVLRAHQLERVVDLSGHSRAESQATERAEVLRGGPFVALLEMTEPEIELGIRPVRILAHRFAEMRRRLAVVPLRVARDPQPYQGIRPFRVFREGRLELARRLGVAALP